MTTSKPNALHTIQSPILSLLIGLLVLLPSSSRADGEKWWIFFKDKGFNSNIEIENALNECESNLNPRSEIRREKLGRDRLVDVADLPVSSRYLSALRSVTGVRVLHTSRWLNGVSVLASSQAVESIRTLPFVTRIQPVGRMKRSPDFEAVPFEDALQNQPRRDPALDYGGSIRQNAFMNLPPLHERGLLGEGVLIGVCDAGFNNLDHECFERLQVEAAWDFVNDDPNVADQNDRGEGSHGTKTLSILAGFAPEHLIGAAPNATYILAKTENTDAEQQIEEDYWIAAVEWMDSIGVDIISSSLGYFDWYDYEELDGETAPITLAADRAVEVGIVVVNAMGNTGFNRFPGDKMGAPADGFRVLSIGATNRDSSRAGFSSRGPTFDGRIKPDFSTYGSSVIFASAANDTVYGAGAGTSFSTPSIAGLCALLIQANPRLTPDSLRSLLRATSDQSENPDTLLGWGIPDGLRAYELIAPPREIQLIPLHEGWNTISIHLTNLPALIFTDYFEQIVVRGNLGFVKDGHGRFYSPEMNFSNIPFWSRLEGYQVRMIEPDTLAMEGIVASMNEPISLREGWQIVAYLPQEEMPVRAAMTSLTRNNNLNIIKDEWGRFYYPDFDFANLLMLEPGRGYQMKLENDAILRYPRRVIDGNQGDTPAFETVHFVPPAPGESNMSVLLIAGTGIAEGDEAACYSEEGNLIGAGVFRGGLCGMAIWAGETLPVLGTFRIWNSATGMEIDPILEKISGADRYQTDAVAVWRVDAGKIPDDFHVSAYPSPFNGILTVKIEQVPGRNGFIQLVDTQGRVIEKKILEAGSRGEVVATMGSEGLTSGIYFIRISFGGRHQVIKTTCLR